MNAHRGYCLLHTCYRPVVAAPIIICPRIDFGQGVITACSPPRIEPCPRGEGEYLLWQQMTVCVPFRVEAQAAAGVPYIQCCPNQACREEE